MKKVSDFIPRLARYPLSYRTLGYILLCSSLFALVSTAAQLYVEYRRDVNHLQANIDLIETSYLAPITSSVYKIDTDGLNLLLNGALKLSGIVQLRVEERRGDELVVTEAGNSATREHLRHEYPLIYSDPLVEERTIGSLTVSASMEGIYHRLLSRVATVLSINAVKTFLTSGGILTIIYWLITRHLIQISDYTRTLQPGKKRDELALNRPTYSEKRMDELDLVVASINGLQERLIHDAARRKEYEEELRTAEEKFRTVADFTYDCEYWVNTDGSLEYISPSCERISGYSPDEFLANPSLLKEIIIAEDRDAWEEHFLHFHSKQTPREVQFRITRKDGQIRWIEHNCQPVIDQNGELKGVRAGNRDITTRKQTELAFKKAYAEIETLKNQLAAETEYLQREIKLSHNFENIIGASPALKYVLYKVEQIAATNSTVLVLGESGTGKELIARAIHSKSPLSGRALVKVNCAALPSDLIESELFGHERGAFTGARERQLGRFEVAHGTTLFLDEIGELPLAMQAKLLGVLQDWEFERLGSSQTIKVDVRVIAATNRDLEEEVRKGRFREDLFFRLNVFPITVPPLRQRLEDIPLLAQFFVEKASRRLGRSIEQIPQSVVHKLQAYSWPGNVRELGNVLERAVINSPGRRLRLEETLSEETGEKTTTLLSLEEIERNHILQVLDFTNWRIEGKKGAAQILVMNPSTLRSRIRKLGIEKP